MPDIFLSYSRKDSQQAIAFAERLRASGMDVWMDKSGIEAATNWTKEIVGAIKDCKAFLILLSAHSQASHNVIKEVSIASEKRKPIIPIELERVPMSDELAYPLAGLQRAHLTDFEGILRSLTKLGIGVVAPASSQVSSSTEPGESARTLALHASKVHDAMPPQDKRKSLMVLPFEDLSPDKDNEWFADGLMSELIRALGRIKSLRLIDQKTSREFKNSNIKTGIIARELNVRYFIEGTVRKFGEQIKISAALLDIDLGEYLWQDSHKGVFADIFEIQESVAQKVVDGLTLTLSADEKKRLQSANGTDNAEAYELYLKAKDYQRGGSKEGLEHSIALATAAINIDAKFAEAYNHKANCLALLYRSYDHNAALLDEADALVHRAITLKPSLVDAYGSLSRIALFRGDVERAVAHAKEYVRNDPTHAEPYSVLGYVYAESHQWHLAIEAFERSLRFDENSATTYFNVCQCCENAKETDKLHFWSTAGLPKYERAIRLRPDDERAKIDYAVLLFWSGQEERATAYLQSLTDMRDAMTEFNIGCLWAQMGKNDEAYRALRRAFEMGFQRYDLFRMFEGPILEMPEYKQLMEEIDAKEALIST